MTELGVWKRIGCIGVDACMVMIGDPCHVLDKKRPKDFGTDWEGFVQRVTGEWRKKPHRGAQLRYDEGHPGLAVVVDSNAADGVYEVWGRFEFEECLELRISFDGLYLPGCGPPTARTSCPRSKDRPLRAASRDARLPPSTSATTLTSRPPVKSGSAPRTGTLQGRTSTTARSMRRRWRSARQRPRRSASDADARRPRQSGRTPPGTPGASRGEPHVRRHRRAHPARHGPPRPRVLRAPLLPRRGRRAPRRRRGRLGWPPSPRRARRARHVVELTLESEALGVRGKLDALRRRDGASYPVEHKRGRAKRGPDGEPLAWESDALQATAYALLLEEHDGPPRHGGARPLPPGQRHRPHAHRRRPPAPPSRRRRRPRPRALPRPGAPARHRRRAPVRPLLARPRLPPRRGAVRRGRGCRPRAPPPILPSGSIPPTPSAARSTSSPRARASATPASLLEVADRDGRQDQGRRAGGERHRHPRLRPDHHPGAPAVRGREIPVHFITTSGAHVGTFSGPSGGVQRRIRQFRGLGDDGLGARARPADRHGQGRDAAPARAARLPQGRRAPRRGRGRARRHHARRPPARRARRRTARRSWARRAWAARAYFAALAAARRARGGRGDEARTAARGARRRTGSTRCSPSPTGCSTATCSARCCAWGSSRRSARCTSRARPPSRSRST